MLNDSDECINSWMAQIKCEIKYNLLNQEFVFYSTYNY